MRHHCLGDLKTIVQLRKNYDRQYPSENDDFTRCDSACNGVAIAFVDRAVFDPVLSDEGALHLRLTLVTLVIEPPR